jgi:predicted RNase H-like HicB family nuclease
MLTMNKAYTAIIKQDKDWWIGWIEEVPGVNCQEKSREELLESLRETLQEALEFNRKEAISAAGNQYSEETIAL